MSVRERRCLNKYSITDCCILNSAVYTVMALKESKKDIWTEWPPCNAVSYYEDFKLKGKDPWGCRVFSKNGLKWPKVAHIDEKTYLIIDNELSVYHAGFGEDNKYREKDIPSSYAGTIDNLHNIHGTIYAVGINRAIVRRDGKDKWTLISKDIKKQAEDNLDVFQAGFNSMDGFAADRDLYAGGGHSDMWHYDGKDWRSIDLPVLRMRIHAVVCAGDEQVYAVGRFGQIVQGRGDSWKAIKQDLTQSDFMDAAWYGDRLYLCTSSRLYELKDGTLKETVFPSENTPSGFGHLYANAGLLMSAGSHSIAIYDGITWKILYGKTSITDADTVLLKTMVDHAEKTVDALSDVLDEVKKLPKQ